MVDMRLAVVRVVVVPRLLVLVVVVLLLVLVLLLVGLLHQLGLLLLLLLVLWLFAEIVLLLVVLLATGGELVITGLLLVQSCQLLVSSRRGARRGLAGLAGAAGRVRLAVRCRLAARLLLLMLVLVLVLTLVLVLLVVLALVLVLLVVLVQLELGARPVHARVLLLVVGSRHGRRLLVHRRREEGGRVVVVVGNLGLRVGGRRHAGRLALRHRLGRLGESLEVELVGVALAVHLLHDVLVVVVSERPAKLVVVHVRLALALAPLPGHLVRIQQLELAVAPLPGDAGCVCLVREQLQQELPQLDLARAGAHARQVMVVVVRVGVVLLRVVVRVGVVAVRVGVVCVRVLVGGHGSDRGTGRVVLVLARVEARVVGLLVADRTRAGRLVLVRVLALVLTGGRHRGHERRVVGVVRVPEQGRVGGVVRVVRAWRRSERAG